MILNLVDRLSRSTSRSKSKCRGASFCCRYFQKIFVPLLHPRKRRLTWSDVNRGIACSPFPPASGSAVFEPSRPTAASKRIKTNPKVWMLQQNAVRGIVLTEVLEYIFRHTNRNYSPRAYDFPGRKASPPLLIKEQTRWTRGLELSPTGPPK
jgi:hypothetical protein